MMVRDDQTDWTRMLPYQIPGQIPDWDPNFRRTNKMQDYRDSFQNQDPLLSEAADIRRRLQALPDVEMPTQQQQEPENFMAGNYGGLESSDLYGLPAWLIQSYLSWIRDRWSRAAQGMNAPVGSPEWENAYMPFIGASAPLNVGAAKAAMAGRGWKGTGSQGASETVEMSAPAGGNQWGRSPTRQPRANQVIPSSNDALESVMSSQYTPAQAKTLQSLIDQAASVIPEQSGGKPWDVGQNYMDPAAWKNASMRYQGRAVRGSDDPLKYSISDAINDFGEYGVEKLAPLAKRAINKLYSTGENIVGALGKADQAISDYTAPYGELAKSLVNTIGQRGQQGMRWGVDAAKSRGVMREPNMPEGTNVWDFIQGNQRRGIPQSSHYDTYRNTPKGSWQREGVKDLERDIYPAIGDFVENHPLAVLAGGPAAAAMAAGPYVNQYLNPGAKSTISWGDILGSKTAPREDGLPNPSWWSNYDFLWGG